MDGKRESEYTLFRFPSQRDKIPEDFIADPKTGLRPGERQKPSGVTKTFIDKGFTEWTAFPPVEVWDRGVWFVMLTEEQQKALGTTVGANAWETWVVNGEGSPGNFLMRLYVVNDIIAAEVEPLHPMLWLEKHKRPSGPTTHTGHASVGVTGFSSGWAHQQNNSTLTKPTTPKTQAPALAVEHPFQVHRLRPLVQAGSAGRPPHQLLCRGQRRDRRLGGAVRVLPEPRRGGGMQARLPTAEAREGGGAGEGGDGVEEGHDREDVRGRAVTVRSNTHSLKEEHVVTN